MAAADGMVVLGRVVAVAGALGVLVASFLPWGRSGGTSRTSYELVDAAGRLEVVSGALAVGVRGWYLVPLLTACTWLAAVRRRLLATATLSALVGSAAVALAVAVKASPVGAEAGTSVALVAGATALIGAARSAWEDRRQS
ncbi:MAG TPA: hypothetical protein VGR26_02265 [Acidimicrobiales bacterium]|nr:hypothetical protein [Acidimicrobiales bacterium]